MTRLERRWAVTAMQAFAPPGDEGLVPEPGEVDWGGTLDEMLAIGTRLSAFGVRLAVWLATFAPWWVLRRPRTLAGLDIQTRARVLTGLLESRVYLVRELMLLLKIVAATALLGVATVRDRSHYDRLPAALEATS